MASPGPEADIELLGAWRAGDTAAGARLFERHLPRVARFFQRKVVGDSEDLVQKVFEVCASKRDDLGPDTAFAGYLFGVARNVLREHFRALRGGRVDFTSRSFEDIHPSAPTVLAKVRERQLLLNALRRIPLDAQIALELHYWEDLGMRDLAEVFEIPVGTAKTRLRRARELLRERLRALAASPEEFASTDENLETWARSVQEYAILDRGSGAQRLVSARKGGETRRGRPLRRPSDKPD